jgi:hypothetical protein
MGRLWRENNLSLVLFALFVMSFIGQSGAGEHVYNEDQEEHGGPPVSYREYLLTGHFLGAVFENWESEFLQMGAYVLLTVVLRQKGSAESKKLDKPEPVDADPRAFRDRPDAPWPVKRGGLVLTLYKNSLSITLFLLFALSFGVHLANSAREYNQEQLEHGGQAVSVLRHLGDARFWFESFQNWQSEFLSIGVLVILSIFLRQSGSPESKPVHAPNSETGQT